jgi:hypothetical protein
MANNRFGYNTLSRLQEANHSPIFDVADLPVLTLEEAVEKLIPLIPEVMDYVAIAKKKYNRHSSLLTRDESAAIYFYSMPTSFFSHLQTALRAENRHALNPWLDFLKLLLTAFEKLPSTKATVWRGVNYDATLTFVGNDVYTWWTITSCSISVSIVQPFLGESGTLFAIETINGKDISLFSAVPDEQEVILMPGTYVRVKSQSLSFSDRLFIVHLEEINPPR